jgi:hypothetical protein
MRKLLVILPLFLTISTIGCSRQIILHPIYGSDMYDGKAPGDKCFSPAYVKEIMKVRIEAMK